MILTRRYKRVGLFGAAFFIVNIFSLLSINCISGAHDHQLTRKESVLGSEPP
ncbi:unnamed protein product, partial [Thlaspi arvense]